MDGIETLLDEVYHGQERMSRDVIYARAVAAELPAEALTESGSWPSCTAPDMRRCGTARPRHWYATANASVSWKPSISAASRCGRWNPNGSAPARVSVRNARGITASAVDFGGLPGYLIRL
jgi:hypothetical protein